MDKYDRFEAWLRENGAKFDLVSYLIVVVTAAGLDLFLPSPHFSSPQSSDVR